tara:strand:+ start:26 stop:424 length:399 start_codon:yes stop_codon:yes gene_type:complete
VIGGVGLRLSLKGVKITHRVGRLTAIGDAGLRLSLKGIKITRRVGRLTVIGGEVHLLLIVVVAIEIQEIERALMGKPDRDLRLGIGNVGNALREHEFSNKHYSQQINYACQRVYEGYSTYQIFIPQILPQKY